MEIPTKGLCAGLLLVAGSAFAQPSINLVDLGGRRAGIEVVTVEAGPFEIALTLELFDHLELTGVLLNPELLFEPIETENPFLPEPGAMTAGLSLDLPNNRFFASFASADRGVGAFDFLEFTYLDEVLFGDVGPPISRLPGGYEINAMILQNGVLSSDSEDGYLGGEIPDELCVDANGDGILSVADITAILSNFGSVNPPPGDANCDGIVSAADITSVLSNFGNVASDTEAVPEPTAAGLLVGVLAVVSIRRRTASRLQA